MKRLTETTDAGESRYIAAYLYESDDGHIFLSDDDRMYTGLETLDTCNGLPALLLAATGLLAGIPSEPIDKYNVHGDFQPPGMWVAEFEIEGDPKSATLTIYPFRCGPAARRLLGLPTIG